MSKNLEGSRNSANASVTSPESPTASRYCDGNRCPRVWELHWLLLGHSLAITGAILLYQYLSDKEADFPKLG